MKVTKIIRRFIMLIMILLVYKGCYVTIPYDCNHGKNEPYLVLKTESSIISINTSGIGKICTHFGDGLSISETSDNNSINSINFTHYYFDKKCKKWAGTGIEKSINEIISIKNIFEWEKPFREGNIFFKKFKSIKIKQWCKKELIYKRKTKLFMKKIKDYFEIANGIYLER